MTSLYSSELRRLLGRRLLWWIAIFVLLGIVVSAIIAFVRTNPGPGESGFRFTDVRSVWEGTSVPMILLAWVLGASYIGSDWQTGTFTTVLTWEARRVRLFLAKVLACAVVILVGYIMLQLVLGLTLFPTAAVKGSTSGMTAEWVRSAAGVLVRGAGVAVVGSIFGMAIAMVGRNTGAALGVGFAYIAVIEAFVRGLRPAWIPYLFGDNAGVFITGMPLDFPEVGRSTIESGMVLLLYAVVLVSIAAAIFKARDVT
jgi:ABC-type transport system involved in multi-copper enzyme maturation permease subunit